MFKKSVQEVESLKLVFQKFKSCKLLVDEETWVQYCGADFSVQGWYDMGKEGGTIIFGSVL